MFDDPELVKRFGSWFDVQVEFYDFICEAGMKMCAQCTKEQMIREYADGKDGYESLKKAVKQRFQSFDQAWKEFHEHLVVRPIPVDKTPPGN